MQHDRRIHYKTEMKLDIYSDMPKEAQTLIANTLEKIWSETYIADLDVEDYVDIIIDLWMRYYIQLNKTKEAIDKIKRANPPKDLKVYLVFNLFDDDDNLIIDYSEINVAPLFRAYIPTRDLWDTYTYSKNMFESLEIIEPAYIEEIKHAMTEKEKMDLDDIILKAYGFHNRLLGIMTKKILLYTAQPPKVVDDWNKKGIIPKGIYFTSHMSRAEYYWNKGDIIIDYRLPEDKLTMTSEFGGIKEYVTIDNVTIR